MDDRSATVHLCASSFGDCFVQGYFCLFVFVFSFNFSLLKRTDLFVGYYEQRHKINNLFKNCRLESNIWQNNEYSDLCDKFQCGGNDGSISAMIEMENEKMNSFRKRCKKGVETVWNSFRRSISFIDLFTDIRLLYLVSVLDEPIIPFIIVLSVSLVCPYIVSYSWGV